MSKLQGRIPLILAVGLATLILATTVYRFQELEGSLLYSSIAIVVSYVAWLFFEGRVTVGETKMASTGIDKGTLEIYALARALTVFTALAMPRVWDELNIWMLIGSMLFFGGIIFRLIAIRTLGRFYSHRVRVASDHQIVNSGPYTFIRHPAYTGMLLANLGFVLFFFSVPAILVYAFGLVPAVCFRILTEEKALFDIPGYSEFAKTRKRLLPMVW